MTISDIGLSLAVRAMRPADADFAATQMAGGGEILPHRIDWAAERLTLLLAAGKVRGGVVEAIGPEGRQPVACGLSTFAEAAAIDAYLLAPSPDLSERLLASEDALLDERAVGERNAGSGLDLVALHFSICDRLDSTQARKVLTASVADFVSVHRGYRLNRLLRVDGLAMAEMSLETGMVALAHFAAGAERNSGGVTDRPFALIAHMRREDQVIGSMVSVMFDYAPPRLGFSLGEARLLTLADMGLTDEQIAQALEISLHTVRQAWRSIFQRARQHLPQVLGERPEEEESAGDGRRGAEKRRHLLAYLKLHPSEMRPHLPPRQRSRRR